MISKYKNKFPFNVYDKMFEDNTGTSLNEDEIDYLLNFADQNIYINSSRELYTFCLFLLKRWYPLFMIKILMLLKTKKILKVTNAPYSIKLLSKDISLVIINMSIAAYGKSHSSKDYY